MENAKPTIFQRLGTLFGSNGSFDRANLEKVNKYNTSGDNVVYRTTDKAAYERELAALRQQKLIAKQWIRANYDLENRSITGLSDVKIMYRDADLMDLFPEIGAALDVLMEETCHVSNGGMLVNVTSKSERVKSILQDLLYNKLSIHMMLPMICRSTYKYGNTFMLLNIDKKKGILGWKQLPVYEIERYENGMENPYASAFRPAADNGLSKICDTQFVWVGANEYIPYQSWQIAHFRLLYDSLMLPYGVSSLNKGRRHFRILSMMEDMMLIYRLERSMERRVYKIDVGTIDDEDVPAYVQDIANKFKRTPIVDPMTGQIDVRKNIMCATDDIFIPTRDPSAPSPIETLSAGQNLTQMDDIKYIQNKVFTAVGVPKPFINYEEAGSGDGKSLSMIDVRFMRKVTRGQQMLLLELNRLCMIHLYLLGFADELTNFTLSMNTASSVAEQLELDNLQKKISMAKDATDTSNGIPIMSLRRAWEEILGWSKKEIDENLYNMRLEKALATELTLTPQIIQRTGIFDPVDNIYGEPDAQYNMQAAGEEEGGMGGGGGFGGGGSFGGGGLGGDLGGMDMGAEGGGEIAGGEGEMDMGEAASEAEGLAGGGGEETTGGEGEPMPEV